MAKLQISPKKNDISPMQKNLSCPFHNVLFESRQMINATFDNAFCLILSHQGQTSTSGVEGGAVDAKLPTLSHCYFIQGKVTFVEHLHVLSQASVCHLFIWTNEW